MSSSNNNLPILNSDVLRMEYRQVVGGNALDKPTAGEKFKRFLARFVSFGSGIGAVVSSFFGPIGRAASAGLYGLRNLADRATERMDEKRARDAAYDEGAASLQGMDFEAPGFNAFYQQNMNQANGVAPSVQWAPFSQGFEREINSNLDNRSGMTSQMINQGV